MEVVAKIIMLKYRSHSLKMFRSNTIMTIIIYLIPKMTIKQKSISSLLKITPLITTKLHLPKRIRISLKKRNMSKIISLKRQPRKSPYTNPLKGIHLLRNK